ncbi:hypothetical protein ES703_91801 [subsurface metagenome]
MKKIILGLFIILFCFSIGIAALQEEELSKEEKAILKKAIEIIKKKTNERIDWEAIFGKQDEEKDLLELMREASKPKEKDELSWFNKYGDRSHPSTIWVTKTDAEKLEEENDRLEDLLRDLRNERSNLEWDMMRYRWDLENARPDPLDYQMAINSAIVSAMIAPHPFKYDSWSYCYYPSSLRQANRTNYEALLFTLSTDSKGKMDWTKYGWLKLLLKNK